MADIFGDNDPNFLIGTAANDGLVGLGGNDVLYGLGGNDVLAGGAGGDYLHGGDGLDYADYRGSGSGVLVDLASGTAIGGDAFGDTLVSIEAVFGSQSGDWLIGNGDVNILHGGGGDDLIQGGGGGDTLVGGAGGDVLDGGAGVDAVSYLQSPTGVIVDLFNNFGAGGHAYGDSFFAIEDVWGSQAQDLIIGNAEANALTGYDGNDVIEGRVGHDTLDGGNGDDNLRGDGGNDLLVAGDGNDTLVGGTGRDTMIGQVGNDVLSGENGPDLLTGGGGRDTLRGGAGADRFIYTALGDSPTGYFRDYQDVIEDFSRADLDRIDLSAIDAVAGAPGNQAFTFIGASAFGAVAGQLRYLIANGITRVQVDVDGNGTADFQTKLMGEIALTASDFIL